MRQWIAVFLFTTMVTTNAWATGAQEGGGEKKGTFFGKLLKGEETQSAEVASTNEIEQGSQAQPSDVPDATTVNTPKGTTTDKKWASPDKRAEDATAKWNQLTSYVRYPGIGFWMFLIGGVVLLGIYSNVERDSESGTGNSEISISVAGGIALAILVVCNLSVLWGSLTALNLVTGLLYLAAAIALWIATGVGNLGVRWDSFTRRKSCEVNMAVSKFLAQDEASAGNVSQRITDPKQMERFQAFAQMNGLASDLPTPTAYRWLLAKWVYTAPIGLPVFFLAHGGKWVADVVVERCKTITQAITSKHQKDLPFDLPKS